MKYLSCISFAACMPSPVYSHWTWGIVFRISDIDDQLAIVSSNKMKTKKYLAVQEESNVLLLCVPFCRVLVIFSVVVFNCHLPTARRVTWSVLIFSTEAMKCTPLSLAWFFRVVLVPVVGAMGDPITNT